MVSFGRRSLGSIGGPIQNRILPSEAVLQGANFGSAILEDAILWNTDASPREDADKSKVEISDFSNANLQRVVLGRADLTSANFSNATLFGADLGGACLKEVNLSNGKLENVDLSGADLENADLLFANLTGSDLSSANFTNAKLVGVNFDRADLTGTVFNGANLVRATGLTQDQLDQACGVPTPESNVWLQKASLHLKPCPLTPEALEICL